MFFRFEYRCDTPIDLESVPATMIAMINLDKIVAMNEFREYVISESLAELQPVGWRVWIEGKKDPYELTAQQGRELIAALEKTGKVIL